MRKILALFGALAIALSLSAQTLTILAGSAEVATSTKNQLYSVKDLYFIYNPTTGGFEARDIENRAVVYAANISTVTIAGLSTAASKIAYIENTHVRANNTSGYQMLVPKDGIAVRYRTSGKYTELLGRYTEDAKPLWYGHLDSVKTATADTTSALRLTALRKIVRGSTPLLIGNTANAPTIAVGAAAGSGGAAAITGTALSGEIDIDTGSSTTTTGILATVTLPVPYPNKCIVTIKGSNTFGSTMEGRISVSSTGSTFVLNANGTAVTASTADLKLFYTVTGY